jgi:RNA polymerase sigma factor for flagellar operon FliA
VGKQITEEFNSLSLELGRTPTAVEVQSRIGIGEARYWNARRASGMRVVSIDSPFQDETNLADRLSDPAPDVSAGIEKEELSEALTDAIALLPGRDRLVLSLYFVEGLTMSNVARAMDISETRVSQLLQRVYARLRTNPKLRRAA